MSDETTKTPEFWRTGRAQLAAMVGFAVIALTLLFGNLSSIGIWEPWEANEISVAQEYATRGAPPELENPKDFSWNGAVPTHKKRPVDRPLLKTWLLAQTVGGLQADGSEVGKLESRSRLPFAVATLLLVVLGFAWLRRRFGSYRAAVAGAVFVSIPATYIGVHNIASEMTLVVTTTLAVLAFAELMFDRKRRWLWGPLFGLTLGLAAIDQRLYGLYLPLLVIGFFAVTELALDEALRQRDGPSAPRKFGWSEVVGAVLAVGAGVALVIWALGTSTAADPEKHAPWAMQLLGIALPGLLAFALLWFGRRSRPGRALWSVPGLIGLAIGVGGAVGVAVAYSYANPILLDGGRVFGDVRVFEFMLNNHVFERSIASDHLTFDIAVRQVGFGLFPWVALFPVGFVYLAQATRLQDEDGHGLGAEVFTPERVARRLLLVWMVVGAVALAAASLYHHFTYAAYFPIAASIGLVLTDAEFWKRARRYPLAAYAVGFVAATIVLMLGKDLERFPHRFVETYLTLEEGFKLPEDFTWGAAYKPLKYAIFVFLIAHFFGLVSWATLTIRRVKTAPEFFGKLRRREWSELFGDPPDDPPYVARAREKEELRQGDGLLATTARWVETPTGFGAAAVIVFWVVAMMFVYTFLPNVTNHVSQRGVFETYTELSDPGEDLFRYQVSSRDHSVYLQHVEALKGSTQLRQKFDSDERLFAVIPRKKLAAINYDIRRAFKRNVHVLDARSSRLLLISNKLEEGETDHNFVADKIVEGEPNIDFPVTFETKSGETKHAVFDNQLKLLGYSLDNEPRDDGLVAYGWGDTMTITYFFEVLKRVPSSQKVFLHVDYPGNRINGDHYPNQGEFPTNYWMPGDIVKDVHPLEIDSYSTPGVYTLNMGLFLGSRRMKVEPRTAHGGRNRITIGKIRVTSGL